MTIPKSCKALAADLASEKIISKTMHGQKEMYMMLADQRKVELDEALAREAGLREDLLLAKKLQTTTDSIVVMVDGQRDHWIEKCGAIKQRLTVAEQRADLLEGLLKSGSSPTYAHCSAVMEALKPAAEPEHICKGCGSKGWTANCAQCVPY